jgi:hypothetical protein
MMLLKLQHELNVGNLVGGTEGQGFRGTKKIGRLRGVGNPSTESFKVKACILLLKQNPHRFGNVSSTGTSFMARFAATLLLIEVATVSWLVIVAVPD